MYNNVKIVAAFTIGLGAGILASKRFFQLKYERIANEEIESVKAKFENRSGHIIERTSLEEPEEFKEKLAEEMKQPEPRIYSTLDSLYETPKEVVAELVEAEHPEDDMPEEPFEITEEEYSETELGFEKASLHYYVEDDILADSETGETDLGQTIGDEGINIVRTDNSIVHFFRNPNYAVDYEVIKVEGSYYI